MLRLALIFNIEFTEVNAQWKASEAPVTECISIPISMNLPIFTDNAIVAMVSRDSADASRGIVG